MSRADGRGEHGSGGHTVNPTSLPVPRIGTTIAGAGHYVPPRVFTNDDLSRLCDTNDAWITSRTGIKQRHIADETENSGTMAHAASLRAIADAGIEARQIDQIIVCTVTPEMAVPSTACLLQHRLGLAEKGIPAYDLVAACSGFIYGLATAHAHMQVSDAEYILLVGVDTLSRFIDFDDRSVAVLFGDGAGAVVLKRTVPEENCILFTKMGADGSGHDMIWVTGGLNRPRGSPPGPPGSDYFMKMDGSKVFKMAVTRMQQLLEEALTVCGLRPEDLSLIVPHQANRRILVTVAEKMCLPTNKLYTNIDRFGNTSAASIPIAYDEVRRQGLLKSGDLFMLLAFGAGLTWGSAVIREP
jgi:3-oxoacyl-[acyl-carrier-protein] synthase-3